MAKGKPPSEARRFLRIAAQRYEDAEILLKNDRTTGAMYLAGYTVECVLKAVIFARSPVAEHPTILKSFRGNLGHDLEWLQGMLRRKKTIPPKSVLTALRDVTLWSTDLRYEPGAQSEEDAHEFIDAVKVTLDWGKQQV